MDKSILEHKEEFYNWMRALVNDNVVRSGKQLDNIIFLGATGGLVLSITVVEVFGRESLNTLPILFASISFFIVALITHVISYHYSVYYNKQVISKLDKWRKAGLVDEFRLPKSKMKEYAGRSYADLLSSIFVILGIVLLAIFVFVNLSNKEVNMNNNINEQDISREKSADNVLPDILDDSDQTIEIAEEQVEEENSQDEPSESEPPESEQSESS